MTEAEAHNADDDAFKALPFRACLECRGPVGSDDADLCPACANPVKMSTWATKQTTCTECHERIEWWPSEGYGPGGWFDPDIHDLDSPGDRCPATGSSHEPAEVES